MYDELNDSPVSQTVQIGIKIPFFFQLKSLHSFIWVCVPLWVLKREQSWPHDIYMIL